MTSNPSQQQRTLPIIIVGAGISGLILSCFLKKHQTPFILYERSSSLLAQSEGYRFRLVDTGLDALKRALPTQTWELLERTHPHGSKPDLLFLDARGGNVTGAMEAKEERCWPVDRPWVREALAIEVKENIRFGKQVEDYELLEEVSDGKFIRVKFQDGESVDGRILIAADGIHSAIRRRMFPEHKLLDLERTCLWGRTPMTSEFIERFGHPNVWEKHFAIMVDPKNKRRSCLFAPVKWPNSGDLSSLSDGQLSNQEDYVFWALCTENPVNKSNIKTINSSPQAKMEFAKQATQEWDTGFRAIFEMMDGNTCYGVNILSNAPEIPTWKTDPRITFMGDAIHAMTPSGGSGGFTATHDAAALGDVILDAWTGDGLNKGKLTEGLKMYEDDMRTRAKQSIERSYAGGKFVWAGKDWWEYEEVKD